MTAALADQSLLVGWIIFGGVMIFLAAIPSSSVALVVAHSVTSLRSGVWCALGIAVADGLLVFTALIGFTLVLQQANPVVLGSVMLLAGLAIALIALLSLRKRAKAHRETVMGQSKYGAFASGFLLTFVDVKALAFYLVLVPSLLPDAVLTELGKVSVVGLTVVTVGGVKVAYAFGADRLLTNLSKQKNLMLQRAALLIMIGVGGVAAWRGASILLRHL